MKRTATNNPVTVTVNGVQFNASYLKPLNKSEFKKIYGDKFEWWEDAFKACEKANIK
jgi:hypothetical protein